MLRKLHGFFKKADGNSSAADRSSNDHNRSSSRSTSLLLPSPKKKSQSSLHKTPVVTDARPNPLAYNPPGQGAQRTSTGGAINRSANASKSGASPQEQKQQQQQQTQPQQKNNTTEEMKPLPRPAAPRPLLDGQKEKEMRKTGRQPTASLTLCLTAHASANATVQDDKSASNALPYSALKRMGHEYGLAVDESSGAYDWHEGERMNSTAAVPQLPDFSSPSYLPVLSHAKRVIPAPPRDSHSQVERKNSKDDTGAYDFGGLVSGEYDLMGCESHVGKNRVADNHDSVPARQTSRPDPCGTKLAAHTHDTAKKRNECSQEEELMPSVINKRRQQESGLYSMFKTRTHPNRNSSSANKGPSATANDTHHNFSSANYDMSYSYVNRLSNSVSERNAGEAHSLVEDGSKPFQSRVTHHPAADTSAEYFDIGEAVDVRPQRTNPLPHTDSAASPLASSTLRRAYELPLSQWKYVALVSQKVAEKKTQVRLSRVKPERRPSLLAPQDHSTVAAARTNSANSDESDVYAPEEEGEEEEEKSHGGSTDVSVYDDCGVPLLIPNLSDLYNDARSSASSGTDIIVDASENSDDDGKEEEVLHPPPSSHSADMGDRPTPDSPPPTTTTEPVSPHAPNTNDDVNHGGVPADLFHRSQQSYVPSPPSAGAAGLRQRFASQQDHQTRQKIMKYQREQLLLQQQRRQQQQAFQPRPQPHPSPPPPSKRAFAPGEMAPQSGPPNVNKSNSKNSDSRANSVGVVLPKVSVGTTGRPWPQPDIRFGPRLKGGRSPSTNFAALTDCRLENAPVIDLPVWAALAPPTR